MKTPEYPIATLAPDPKQHELPLRPRLKADVCSFCGSVHTTRKERLDCIQQGG
jgi:hypothetical protein